MSEDGFRYAVVALADRLHMTIADVEEMPYAHFLEFYALYELRAEKRG